MSPRVEPLPEPLPDNEAKADERDEEKALVAVRVDAPDAKEADYRFKDIDDAGKYDDVMKPWEKQNTRFALDVPVGDFAFSCCSELPTGDWTNSVFHKTGADRLIIKRRHLVTETKPKNLKASIWMEVCCCPCKPWKCCIPQQIHESHDMVTQSVPIQSIFFVERNVMQLGDTILPKGCCACLCRSLCCCMMKCCFKAIPPMDNYSDISIGYNRSNESNKMHNDEGKHSAKTQDYITITLLANQAFNLHRYINAILDKTVPREDIVVDSGLPR